jgi:glycosyltransferase involved in cell wall biosynthesis
MHLVGADFIDEILVPSSYVAEVFQEAFPNKKVHNVKKWITTCPPVKINLRRSLRIPQESKLFLSVGDFGSSIERKNLLASVRAFKAAVKSEAEGVLVLKVRRLELGHWSNKAGHWQKLMREIDGDGRFRVLARELSEGQYWGMLDETDAFLSLHRSEGFGYGLAHMLCLGKPVITTGYSGVTDFCTPETAYLVDYELENISPWMMNASEYIGVWAEPSLEAAAAHISTVIEDYEGAVKKALKGKELMNKEYSLSQFTRRLCKALAGA